MSAESILMASCYAVLWLVVSILIQPDMEDWPFWRWPQCDEYEALLWPLVLVIGLLMLAWEIVRELVGLLVYLVVEVWRRLMAAAAGRKGPQ